MDAASRRSLLLAGPIPSMLFRLAAPNVLATSVVTASTFADAWYVGQLGTPALAALALVFPFQTLMVMMCGGAIGGAVTSSVSRALGRSDEASASAAAWHGMLIAAVMAALFTLVLGVHPRPLFALLGGTGEALEGAVAYAHIVFGGAITVWWLWGFAAILRGTGDTETPARAVMVSGLIQIAMSGALTLGWGPLPALGVSGPAAAMVLCHGGAAAYLGWRLVSGRAALALNRQSVRLAPVIDIMRVGGLGLANSASIALTVIVVTGLVGRYGTEALAGYGLGSRLELMLIPFVFGIGGALTVAVGTNFGAGQAARARRIAWSGAAVTFLVVGIAGIAVALVPALWLDLFTADARAYSYGAQYLLIAGPLYGLFAAGQTLYFASQGTGRVGLPVSVSLSRLIIVASLGSGAIAIGWSVDAVFASVAIGLAVYGLGQAACLWGPGWRPDRYGEAGPSRASFAADPKRAIEASSDTRAISLAEARSVFGDEQAIQFIPPGRANPGQAISQPMLLLGRSGQGSLCVVEYREREDRKGLRLTSARIANDEESRHYRDRSEPLNGSGLGQMRARPNPYAEAFRARRTRES